jgi:methionine aminotransferase
VSSDLRRPISSGFGSRGFVARYAIGRMRFVSKLPDVGTTIFTLMSRRARELGALNIGQGFPDYPIDPQLAECLNAAVADGCNQYAPMEGVPELREVVSRKLAATQSVSPDPEREITITCGGTEGLFSSIQAVLRAGDDAIVFDPAYDVYDPAIRLAGGRSIRVPTLPPTFRPDWDRVRAAVTPATRLIIINNPHNPACAAWRREDIEALAALVRDRDVTIIADEVYEHVVFDGRPHCSVLSHAELAQRSLAVYSFGKTLHATGWRTGYVVAPPELTTELRKVHQFNTFSIAAPLQHAIVRYLTARPDAWRDLSAYFERKRDLLRGALVGTGFELPPAAGTYFQLLDYGALSGESDTAFAQRLLDQGRVACIPLTPFYAPDGADRPRTLVRLCIAKRDDTLLEAAARLAEYAERLQGRA